MSGKRHLMVIGAHAMDAECMAGVVVVKYTSQGHRVSLVHLTRGERGHPSKPPEQFGPQLEEEMKLAAKRLGADCIYLGFSAGEFPSGGEVEAAIAQLIRKEKPHVIITHWRGSWHPRHVAAHESVVHGVKLAADPGYQPRIHEPWQVADLVFGENCEDLHGFGPTVYVDVDGFVEPWLEALREYELFHIGTVGGGPRPGQGIPYESYYTAMVKVRGLESGCPAAQAFMTCRRLGNVWSYNADDPYFCNHDAIRFFA